MQRVEVDLSVARGNPTSIWSGTAFGIRFHAVPAPFSAYLDGSSPDKKIEVESPFSYERCNQPVRQLLVQNAQAAGTAIIFLLEAGEKFSDFLADSSAGGDQITSALTLSAAGNVRDLVKAVGSAEATAANVALITDAASQFHGTKFTAAAGVANTIAEMRRQEFTHSWLPWRHAPGGTGRAGARRHTRNSFMQAEIEIDRQAGAPADREWFIMGYWDRTGSVAYPFGIGFATSFELSDNLFAAVIQRNAAPAGVWPVVADRLVWQDLGVSALTAFQTIRLLDGVNGDTPYLDWIVNGAVVYRHTGPFSAFLSPNSNPLQEYLAVFHAAAAVDNISLWHPGPWMMGYTG